MYAFSPVAAFGKNALDAGAISTSESAHYGMFKFDFNLDDLELEDDPDILNISNQPVNNAASSSTNPESSVSFNVSSISDLIPTIPPAISYSPLKIPVPAHSSHPNDRFVTLLRRDLFDARFQLSSEDSLTGESNAETGGANDTLAFVDAPSDLIAGVYEGGLKTWECSLDLAGYLANLELDLNTTGNDFSILEIGCGTAIPSLFCLKRLFNSPPPSSGRTIIHLQDYNFAVLKLRYLLSIHIFDELVDVSSASEKYRETLDGDEEFHTDAAQLTAEPGELPLTSKLISAFQNSLEEHRINIKFIGGSWQDTNKWISETGTTYSLILSSETIYRISSVPSLIALLRNATSQTSETNIDGASASYTTSLCLIAAKVIYFGVGGGVESFVKAVENDGGRSDIVFETTKGVSRKIMKISWS